MYEKIKKWYSQGLWTEETVHNAVEKKVITKEQAKEVLEG